MSPRAVARRAGVQAHSCGCGTPVLKAVSESGLDVVLDQAALTAVGELQAILGGVVTYTHHLVPDEVHHRSPWSIRARPAGTRPRQRVHALHRCGTAWPALNTLTSDRADPDAGHLPPY